MSERFICDEGIRELPRCGRSGDSVVPAIHKAGKNGTLDRLENYAIIRVVDSSLAHRLFKRLCQKILWKN